MRLLLFIGFFRLCLLSQCQMTDLKSTLLSDLDKQKVLLESISDSIWYWSEPTFYEYKTVNLLKRVLRSSGFAIQDSIAGLPTMFIASYGDSGPQIDILSEADADGMKPKTRIQGLNITQHSAGHHLLAVGSLGAVISLKKLIEKGLIDSRIRFVHSTAEGSLGGRVFMTKEGFFDETDLVFFWHPAPVTSANLSKWDAIIDMSIKFSNSEGLDALNKTIAFLKWLDTIEAEFSGNLMIARKVAHHSLDVAIKEDTMLLNLRLEHTSQRVVNDVYERVRNYLDGKAKVKVYRAVAEFIPNTAGNMLVHSLMNKMDWHFPVKSDSSLAGKIFVNADKSNGFFLPQPLAFKEERDLSTPWGYGSDIGDVSWHAPLISFVVSWIPTKISMRNWQGGAFGSTAYAKSAMAKAAQLIACSTLEYLAKPNLREQIKSEHQQRVSDWQYKYFLKDNPDIQLNTKRSY